MSTSLPEGFYSRPITPGDAHQIAALAHAQSTWLNGVGESIEILEEEFQSEWGFEFINPETDTLAVFTTGHQAVGYSDMFDVRPPHVSLMGMVIVHPEHLGCGIGSYLAGWLEERARRNTVKAPAGAQVVMHQSILSSNHAAISLLQARGYRHIRDSYRMRIDFDQPPAAPTLPPGIVIRAIQGEDEERMALFARYESFLDHWGAVDEGFEAYYRRWKDIIARDPHHDPTLWFMALDGDQPAGITVNYSLTEDDPDMGWVQSLGVRRPWRKRGVGLALLQHTFRALYARGKKRAGLGVDASSLTGATRLYERAGMRVERTFHTFELELRPGETLTRQSVD